MTREEAITMRLPQDRILHIDTELAGDEVRVVAEWQRELVRCKDCRHAQYDATHYFCAEHHHKVYEDDYCSHGQRLSNFGERAEQTEVKENDELLFGDNHNNNVDANYKSPMRLIDADALKAKWYEINDIDETDRGARFVGYTEIARLIDDAPTVEVGRPHGEWLNNEQDIPICSNCGYFTPYDRAIDDYEYGNFCPNCGAEMRADHKLPFHDDIMEKLDKLTLRGDDHD